MEISKSRIDRLGDRLRKANISEDDLRLLDEYRRSFAGAYDEVVGIVRQQLSLEPTGRPAKSTTSIAEKLRRESIRLSQIQDIAGCRLVVSDIADQERVMSSLLDMFPSSIVVDRRQKPSHGYRAVHIIATIAQKAVEIQIRTALQQVWAEFSEKLADVIDASIKYGGGDDFVNQALSQTSLLIANEETNEATVLEMQQRVSTALLDTDLTEERRVRIMEVQAQIASLNADIDATRKDTLVRLREAVQEFTKPLE